MKDEKLEVGNTYKNGNGSLTVIKYERATRVLIRHNDDFGHEMWTQADRIRKGGVKNPFETHENGKSFIGYGYCHKIPKEDRHILYTIWRGVVQRTLSNNYAINKKHNPYEGVTMCERWYNFQNFCQDVCKDMGYNKDFHLDKDLLVRGNKIYSPETCCFIPPVINQNISIFYKTKSNLPVGVNKKKDYFEAAISINGKRVLLGSYGTIEEASIAYVVAKEEHIKSLALEWKELIKPNVFEALMNWTVY